MNKRSKQIIQSILCYMAVVFLAFMAFMNLNLHGGRITDAIESLNSIILIALLTTMLSRAFKINWVTTVLTIIADTTLIVLTFDVIITGDLWETSKNILIEPAVTMTVLAVLYLLWDWFQRIKQAHFGIRTIDPNSR